MANQELHNAACRDLPLLIAAICRKYGIEPSYRHLPSPQPPPNEKASE